VLTAAEATDHADRHAVGVDDNDSMQAIGFTRAAKIFERLAGSVRAWR
jgi:hypothetical protein